MREFSPGADAAPTAATLSTPVVPERGRRRPLGLDDVRLDPASAWGHWQQVNHDAILPHCVTWLEHVGSVANFDQVAAGADPADRRGREFTDSDVYKLLEALVWETHRAPSASLVETRDSLIDSIASAQQPDGYLNTNFGRPGQAPRYSDLAWGHELYCYGHLIQAAVAAARSDAKGSDDARDALIGVARRAADHICSVFGEDGIESVCGHPEIEMALVELSRVTGVAAYRHQAELFVERRGRGTLPPIEFGAPYFQDDIPVRDATVLRGHAVRALYLAAGAVDVAVDTGDADLLSAVEAQWAATVARRTYLTGGMGSRYEGEAFGDDFELPADRAYCETCAGIGSIMLSWRLLLATGQARFADLIERTLYNVVTASPAADGQSFFYVNKLHQRHPGAPADPASGVPAPRSESSTREPWFEVSCCPTNVARTLATLGCYEAAVAPDALEIYQWFPGTIRATLGDPDWVGSDHADSDHADSAATKECAEVEVRVETSYPSDGHIRIKVLRAPDRPWTLRLRVPGWAGCSVVRTLGASDRVVSPGMIDVPGPRHAGAVVELELPVKAHWVIPDPRIDAVRGCLAVQRGPVVYAMESVDLPAGICHDSVRVVPGVDPRDDAGKVSVLVTGFSASAMAETSWPYAADSGVVGAHLPDQWWQPLIPYASWAERGPSTMRVWLPKA